MNNENLYLRKINWNEVKDTVRKKNNYIFNLIEKLNPSQQLSLYKVKYPFGMDIINKGTLLLPTNQRQYVPINSNLIPEAIKKDLNYSHIPLGIFLNTYGETYINNNYNYPLNIFPPGEFFGLWEVLDKSTYAFSKRLWNISAGTKSIFMLPKITNFSSFAKLIKEYKLRQISHPKNLFEHVDVFAEISSKSKNWYCDILFFSGKWFAKQDNKDWLKFQYYLLKKEWDKSLFWRNKVTFELLGQTFADAQESKNLSPNQYLIDTVMHLISIATGVRPGFEPAINEEAAPISQIQDAFIKAYDLKQYIPTLMCSTYFLEKNLPIYYSMNHPTVPFTSAKLKKPHSMLNDLCMVRRLLLVLQNKMKEENPPIYSLIKDIEFSFYHTEEYEPYDIKNSAEIPTIDNRFLINKYDNNRIFCKTSPFMRSCIMIRKTK